MVRFLYWKSTALVAQDFMIAIYHLLSHLQVKLLSTNGKNIFD